MEQDLFEQLDVNDIKSFIPYNAETIRRYFRKGILFTHDKKHDGISSVSIRGSVEVRYKAMLRLRTKQKRLSLEDMGYYFSKFLGDEDEFIISRLKENKTVEEIIKEVLEEFKKVHIMEFSK